MGRHRFAGTDHTVRPLLAAVIPVVAVLGLTVAAVMGGQSPATSAARIEVPRFAGADSVPAVTSAAVPSALPEGIPAIMNVSSSGTSAIARIRDERAEAQRAQARAAQASRERAAADASARDRAAQDARRAAAAAPAAPQSASPSAPTTTPAPTSRPAPATAPEERTPAATPGRGGLLDGLLGGRGD